MRRLLPALKSLLRERTPALRSLSVPAPPPPAAHTQSLFNGRRSRTDEFADLQAADSAECKAYIARENAHARSVLDSYGPLTRALLSEFQALCKVDGEPEPVATLHGRYEYVAVPDHEAGYGELYCRRDRLSSGAVEVFARTCMFEADGESLRTLLVSPGQTRFAALTSVDGSGDETGRLHIFDAARGRQIDTVENVFNFVWMTDGIVLYTAVDEVLRAHRVMAHRVAATADTAATDTAAKTAAEAAVDAEADVVLYEEKDRSFFVDVTATRGKRFMAITSSALSSSKVHLLDIGSATWEQLKAGNVRLQLAFPSREHVEGYVDQLGDHFYCVSNPEPDAEYQLRRSKSASSNNNSSSNRGGGGSELEWEPFVDLEPGLVIEDVALFQSHIAVFGRIDGVPCISVHDVSSGDRHMVSLPEKVCTVKSDNADNAETGTLRFTYSSPTTNHATVDYDMVARRVSRKWASRPTRYNPRDFVSEMVSVPAPSAANSTARGTVNVPVTLIRPHRQRSEPSPVLMHVYGAYGMPLQPDFRLDHLALLRRGWTVALAHVRGGGELGRQWYRDGRLDRKCNSVSDALAVAEALLQRNTHGLAIAGLSAGGLTAAMAINTSPELFTAGLLEVPFADPMSALLDDTHPLSRVEFNEWGNPLGSEAAFDSIMSVSPYETIPLESASKWPSLMITSGMNDQRVAYWQPLKYAARLRSRLPHIYQTSESGSPTLIMHTADDGDHFSSSSSDSGGDEYPSHWQAMAERTAFLINALNVQ